MFLASSFFLLSPARGRRGRLFQRAAARPRRAADAADDVCAHVAGGSAKWDRDGRSLTGWHSKTGGSAISSHD